MRTVYLIYLNNSKCTGGWYLERIYKTRKGAISYIKKEKIKYYNIETERLYE